MWYFWRELWFFLFVKSILRKLKSKFESKIQSRPRRTEFMCVCFPPFKCVNLMCKSPSQKCVFSLSNGLVFLWAWSWHSRVGEDKGSESKRGQWNQPSNTGPCVTLWYRLWKPLKGNHVFIDVGPVVPQK